MSKLARYCLAAGAFAVMSVPGWAEACPGDPAGRTNCGGGASARPPEFIRVSTCQTLQKIGKDADHPLDGRYRLDNDIDLTECFTDGDVGSTGLGGWQPIGSYAVSYSQSQITNCGSLNCVPQPEEQLFAGAFTGVFDGNGYTIRGLNGLVTIPYNVERVEPVIYYIMSSGLFGSLRGAVVQNLTIEDGVAAVDGASWGPIYTIGAGLLAGFSRYAAITDVRVTGKVEGYAQNTSDTAYNVGMGGLLGRDVWSTVSKCSSAVTVTVTPIIRSPAPPATDIPNCKIGGIVGTGERTAIEESYSAVTLSGLTNSAGGLMGESIGGNIFKSGAKVTSVQSLRAVDMGGLAGSNRWTWGSSCLNCDDIGQQSGRITYSYAAVSAELFFDGLVRAGGLIGYDDGGLIANSYATGSIKFTSYYPPPHILSELPAPSYMGGLVGFASSFDGGSIEQSYAAVTGPMPCSSWECVYIGGLVGSVPYSEDILHSSPYPTCYWDTERSAIFSPIGDYWGFIDHNSGRTTEEMYQRNTFAGWDFTSMRIWKINEGESYPYFAWQDGPVSSISWNRSARAAGKNKLAPAVTVRGKTINIKTSSANDMQVRLIDMRGRTVTRFNAAGGNANFSASKISAGRYIVDMKEMKTGKRFTSAVVLR